MEKKKRQKKARRYKGIDGTKKKDIWLCHKLKKSTSSWFSQMQKCPKLLTRALMKGQHFLLKFLKIKFNNR